MNHNPAAAPDRAADSTPFPDTVRFVEAGWSDHQGHMRGKRVPVERVTHEATFNFCNAALAWDYLGTLYTGTTLETKGGGFPDGVTKPDFSTVRILPWEPSRALVLCDVTTPEGDLLSQAPRTVLRRATQRLAELGFRASVGVELEFYLLDADGTRLPGGDQPYSLSVTNEMDPFVTKLSEGLGSLVDVEALHTEYGPGQFEINTQHCEPLAAADGATIVKYATREIARRCGQKATFMAKPFNGRSGCSMHLHASLRDLDGNPVFAPESGRPPKVMRAAIGGLVRHLPGMTAYLAPTVNSYRRFEVDSFAPTNATWGGDNRTVAVRVLLESAHSSRLELRTPGADANPYWAVAALLAGIIAGIEADADPGLPGQQNAYGQGTALPATLGAAVELAEHDHVVASILGKDATSDFLHLARGEWNAFTSHVSDWDIERYLPVI